MSEVLFYERPVPLNRESHKDLRLKAMSDVAFARKAHSIPLACIEFPAAAHDFPVLFAGPDTENANPVALTGVRKDENLLVDAEGHWSKGAYIPAFVRRYPFVLAEKSDAEQGNDFAVFLDQESGLLGSEEGERLFNEDGTDSDVMQNVVRFLTDYQSQIQTTRSFMKRLNELDLLVGRNIEIKLPGNNIVLNGLFVVDEEKLKKLDAQTTQELLRDNTLAWIYAHLFSLTRIDVLLEKLNGRLTPEERAKMAEAVKPDLT